MAQPQTKKPSFFRRLSLSSPNPTPVVSRDTQERNGTLARPADTSRRAQHGVSVNTLNQPLPPGAAPSAFKGDGLEGRLLDGVRSSMRNGSSSSADPRPLSSPTTIPKASPNGLKHRSPIYPALASPPTSPPRRVSHQDAYSVAQGDKPVNFPPDLGQSPRSSDPVKATPPKSRRAYTSSVSPEEERIASNGIGRYADADVFHSQPVAPHIGTMPAQGSKRSVSSRPANRKVTSAERIPPPSSFPSPVRSPASDHGPSTGITEASAYARDVAASRKGSGSSRDGAASAPPAVANERRASRPLPRPPSETLSQNGPTVHVIAHNDGTGTRSLRKSGSRDRPNIVIPPVESKSDTFIGFPRSPTLPPLIDPRQNTHKSAMDSWTGGSGSSPSNLPLQHPQLPARTTSISQKRIVSGTTFASPVATSPSSLRHHRRQSAPRPNRRPTLPVLLAQPHIQAALLPFLSINSFLSLTGSSDIVRKRFSGEIVGRWIMKEWGVSVDKEKGRSWPNLTVWEGFLESLLHDPATYSTYPAQWYNLLRHLSLSHTLIVLQLRSLPPTAFPIATPLPFEDENLAGGGTASRPHSRVGSDTGSIALGKMPRQERLMEIVMPEPLASRVEPDHGPVRLGAEPTGGKLHRRSSVSSFASAASFSFGRKRSNSTTTPLVTRPDGGAASMAVGKAALPPVSYPVAKRYGFTRHGDQPRTRTFSDSSRPGSVFSVQSGPSVALSHWITTQNRPPMPSLPSGISGFVNHRSSTAGSEVRRSPIHRFGSPFRRDQFATPVKVEPAFDRAIPFVHGRAPILRVFVPLSDRVPRWPSAEGAAAAVAELDKCGATRRLRFGDLVVNTACRQPKTTEHVLVFVPFVKHLLVPFDYRHASTGHLPPYVDGFALPPSYYYPFLPSPQILYLDLTPYRQRGLRSIRLAFDRRDVTIASGAKMAAKRYLHVAGFEVTAEDPAAAEWQGIVSLEADGTAEGKADMVERFNGSKGPWEVVREKSMAGTVWLRLVKEVKV